MDAAFLKILNMSITANWLILAVVILRLALKKAPKWVICALWALVGLLLLLPFSFESVLSLIPSAETVSPEILYAQEPVIHSGVPAINSALNPVIIGSLAPTPDASVNPLQIWTAIAAYVWLVGIAAMLLYAAVSFLRLRKKVVASLNVRDKVWVCDDIKTPFILGVLRPRIYLPSGMDTATESHVIAHESAHLKRLDHIWKPLGFLLLAAYWFNPLCWLAYILLCRDIELACDERVIRSMDKSDIIAYSEALYSCSVPRRSAMVCPLAFGEVGVKERIKTVLNYKKPAFWIIIVAVVVCVAVAVCFMTNPKADEADLGQDAPVSVSPSDSSFVPLTEEQIAQANEAFASVLIDEQGNSRINPLSCFFTSYYDRPEDINFAEFLRYFPEDSPVSDGDEFDALTKTENWPFPLIDSFEEMYVPTHRYLSADINAVLNKYMGISISDLSGVGMEDIPYLPEYDAYYNFTSDFGPGTFHCTGGETDGETAHFTAEYYGGSRGVLTMKLENGSWMIKSLMLTSATDESSASGSKTDDSESAGISLTVPDGLTLSDYSEDIGQLGGWYLLPEAYSIVNTASTVTPLYWRTSGSVTQLRTKDTVRWDGNQIAGIEVYSNHTQIEGLEPVTGLCAPAYLTKNTYDLYTAADLAELAINISYEESVSEYWCLYLARPGEETGYVLSLDARQFSKDDILVFGSSFEYAS